MVAFDIGFPDQRDAQTDKGFRRRACSQQNAGCSRLTRATTPMTSRRQARPNRTQDDPARRSTRSLSRCSGARTPTPTRTLRARSRSRTSSWRRPTSGPMPTALCGEFPMFVQPACFTDWRMQHADHQPSELRGVSRLVLRTACKGATSCTESDEQATFGESWPSPFRWTASGAALDQLHRPSRQLQVGRPIHLVRRCRWAGAGHTKIKGKIVLVGAYNLTGFNDEQLVTTSPVQAQAARQVMQGVEMHANAEPDAP